MAAPKTTKAFDGAALAALVDELFARLEDSEAALREAQRAHAGAPDHGAAYSLGQHLEALKLDVARALARYKATTAASCALASGEPLFDHHGKCSGCGAVTACAMPGYVRSYCRACMAARPHRCGRPECAGRTRTAGTACDDCCAEDADAAQDQRADDELSALAAGGGLGR
jgi:hypothetical protein